MANPTALTDMQKDENFSSQSYQGSENIPSGFILKLYQMVNGAPDEVISWTPAGDAFIIGSDLNRLESETLPQYFRHNRFQSLVRQLNFYSFRKINRERNVWIYKHHLFHRDRPEDLHLVRRRTCPGLDGRKQRFSRFSARNLRQSDVEKKRSPSDEEDSSMEETSEDDASEAVVNQAVVNQAVVKQPDEKREEDTTEILAIPPEKGPVVLWSIEPEPTEVIDTSFVTGTDHKDILSQRSEEEEVKSTGADGSERLEMIEQSMIVSDVAMKLEEYVRKAMKGRGGLRSRRGGAGVVTPPYSNSPHLFASSRGLLTYDDEYDDIAREQCDQLGLSVVVTDGDDSLTDEDEPPACIPKELLAPAVKNPETVKSITDHLLAGGMGQNPSSVICSSAAVAGFCMSTAPLGDPNLSAKILQLIASCETLAAEFQLYRAALNPLDQFSITPPSPPYAVTGRMIWEREACRGDAVRDFKTYSVNCIQKFLGKKGVDEPCSALSKRDRCALERTADIWLKSVGTTVG